MAPFIDLCLYAASLVMMLPTIGPSAHSVVPVTHEHELSDGTHDFDFIIGTWKIQNRRLLRPLTNSSDWYSFEGRSVVRPIWGGAANLDEFTASTPAGPIEGMTLRIYNPQSKEWSLIWVNKALGTPEKPMIGHFTNGRGEFFDQEDFKGKPISVRYIWSEITKQSARWEQAFSEDGGKTWETNWIMEERRETEKALHLNSLYLPASKAQLDIQVKPAKP